MTGASRKASNVSVVRIADFTQSAHTNNADRLIVATYKVPFKLPLRLLSSSFQYLLLFASQAQHHAYLRAAMRAYLSSARVNTGLVPCSMPMKMLSSWSSV